MNNVEPMFGLREDGLAAFRKAQLIVDAAMRPRLATVHSLRPLISLRTCPDCVAGKRTVRRNGAAIQYECGTCWGHGTLVRS